MNGISSRVPSRFQMSSWPRKRVTNLCSHLLKYRPSYPIPISKGNSSPIIKMDIVLAGRLGGYGIATVGVRRRVYQDHCPLHDRQVANYQQSILTILGSSSDMYSSTSFNLSQIGLLHLSTGNWLAIGLVSSRKDCRRCHGSNGSRTWRQKSKIVRRY